MTLKYLGNDNILYVNVSYDFRTIIYINEKENFMRVTFNCQKEWYNSFLQFQNLKNNSENLIFEDDKNNMWNPTMYSINIESQSKCQRTEEIEISKIVPNKEFNYTYNSFTSFQNAFLFEGSKNYVVQNWTWSCEYICKFEYSWYPFDTQSCHKLNQIAGNLKLRPLKLYYSGNEDLGKYYFRRLEYCERDKYGRDGLFITFLFSRPIMRKVLFEKCHFCVNHYT